MGWLISLLIAGTMFSNGNNLSFQTNNFYENAEAASVGKAQETERFEQTYPLSGGGKISVSNVNGSITVEGWDKPEVKLEYVKTADTKERLADVQIKIDARKDSLDVEAEYNQNDSGSRRNKNEKGVEVEFRLMVPRDAALNEIETVNGSVSISNTTNSTKASAVNGEVKALNLSGAAELSTVNGMVSADFDRLENTSRISLETVNGQAFLTVPSDANATVKAETLNGKITNDFGLPVRIGQYVGHSLYGRIGTGDVKIRLESVNGELSLRRRQDGKNPNPVTNLLESKSDDETFDDAGKEAGKAIGKAARVTVDVPQINAETRRAIAEAQREIAKAKINVNINSAEMQRAIREGMAQQQAAMDRMREAGWFSGSPSVDRKSESFPVKGVPKVTINAKDCAVSVRGWDKPEVQYTLTRISRNNASTPIQYTVNHSDSEVNINVAESSLPTKDNWVGNMNIRIEVFVPRKSNLKIVTDHAARLENVSGELDIQGGEESIDVRDSDGNLTIAAGDGKVRIIGFRGAVDAETVDGLISLEGDFQKLSARAADGAIILTLPENADATIESNRKNISFEGVPLVYQGNEKNTPTWKVGRGAANYSLFANGSGKIFVRSSNSLRAN